LRLYNITSSLTLLASIGGRSYQTNDATQVIDMLSGQFTLSETSVLEIQHRCKVTRADYGFGIGNDWGDPCIFTVAQFWKMK
jgi:hypothetical protein